MDKYRKSTALPFDAKLIPLPFSFPVVFFFALSPMTSLLIASPKPAATPL